MEASLIKENQYASPLVEMVASITGSKKRVREDDVDFESSKHL